LSDGFGASGSEKVCPTATVVDLHQQPHPVWTVARKSRGLIVAFEQTDGVSQGRQSSQSTKLFQFTKEESAMQELSFTLAPRSRYV